MFTCALTHFFRQCLRASKDLIRTLVDDIGTPQLRASSNLFFMSFADILGHLGIYLRHGPDSECVFVTFTCAFLIKVHFSSSVHLSYANPSTISFCIPSSQVTFPVKREWKSALWWKKSPTS